MLTVLLLLLFKYYKSLNFKALTSINAHTSFECTLSALTLVLTSGWEHKSCRASVHSLFRPPASYVQTGDCINKSLSRIFGSALIAIPKISKTDYVMLNVFEIFLSI
jgi:hypothetical protein